MRCGSSPTAPGNGNTIPSAFSGSTWRRTGPSGRGSPTGLSGSPARPRVVGGGESAGFHADDAERLVARLPHGRNVTIPRAGHTVQGDNPKDLVAELRRFLAGDN